MRAMNQDISKKMALLAYIAYSNLGSRGYYFFKRRACRNIAADIEYALHEHNDVLGGLNIVWGPAAHFPYFFSFASALMFIVRDPENSDLTVVIRGTNPLSLISWIQQDFAVSETRQWDAGDLAKGNVSLGTSRSIAEITALCPRKRMPGARTSLADFLNTYFAEHSGATLRITGHSLGGMLASVVGLWLNEQCPLLKNITQEIHAFAGPTAGDTLFARHCDQVFSEGHSIFEYRYVNVLDVAPRAWNVAALQEFELLYDAEAGAGYLDNLVIEAVIKQIEGLQYEHSGQVINIPSQIKEGALYDTLLTQALYQHVSPYLSFYFDEAFVKKILKDIFKSSITL